MKKNLLTRRHFLQSSVLAASALPAVLAAADAAAPGGEGGIYRGIFPQHGNLLQTRSERSRRSIEDSLRGSNARPVTLAVCQMRNHCDGEKGKQANLQRMLAAMDDAAREKVQILVFPEMCLSGYFTPLHGSPADARKANRALADVVGESRYLASLRAQARRLGMVVTFGFGLRESDKVYNGAACIDSDGTWLGARRKNPLYPWPYEQESFDVPAAEERSAVFATRLGMVGLSICFDGEFPESIRRMRLMGAEILLWSNAAIGNPKLGTSNRIAHCGCHSITNRLWVACCDCAAENTSGTSVITGIDGEPLVILPPGGEALGVATVNLAQSSDWSEYRAWLDPLWKSDPVVFRTA